MEDEIDILDNFEQVKLILWRSTTPNPKRITEYKVEVPESLEEKIRSQIKSVYEEVDIEIESINIKVYHK